MRHICFVKQLLGRLQEGVSGAHPRIDHIVGGVASEAVEVMGFRVVTATGGVIMMGGIGAAPDPALRIVLFKLHYLGNYLRIAVAELFFCLFDSLAADACIQTMFTALLVVTG